MKKAAAFLSSLVVVLALSGCEAWNSSVSSLKGELIGNQFDVSFYDNYGSNFLTVHGNKVSVSANKISVLSVNSDGSVSTAYENSSVITITVDGQNMEQTGNTVVFAEMGLNKLKDFELPDSIQSSGGTIQYIDRNINHYKNLFGTQKVVVICSQLGIPIAAYGGESVYWEVPSDLPKMTKLSIDGKALYIHRANYVMLDSSLIQ